LSQALHLDPGLVQARINLAVCFLRTGRPRRAEQELLGAARFEPDNVDIDFHLGNVRDALNDPDGALRAWRRVLAAQPRYVAARCNLANVLERRGEWQEAMREYETALEANPDIANAHFRLGVLYLHKRSDVERARHHLARGLELAPDHAMAPAVEALLRELVPGAVPRPEAAP
jgi:tetratricopeptide (TPR) repeat protein